MTRLRDEHEAWVAWNDCQGPFYETCAWRREEAEQLMRERKLQDAGCVVVPIAVRIRRRDARDRGIRLPGRLGG